ncbi:MAG: hypothetical protein K2O06_17840 [Acetatifactor sp.]|nr:hypothetical protein [Acetatifactor sp.]
MKVIKGILWGIVALLITGGLIIMICALNPALTGMLAEQVEALGVSFGGSSGSTDADTQNSGGGSIGIAGIGGLSGGSGTTQPDTPGIDAGWIADRGDTGYVAPENSGQTPPEEVGNRNGYQPVADDAEQIPQEEADNLGNVLSYGELGEGLSFSEEYYPYYAMLQADLQKLYCQIYANAIEQNISFAPVVSVTMDRVKTVFEAVYNDHPELFWLETGYSGKFLGNGTCVEITLKYNDTANDLDGAKQIFEAGAEQILSGARNLGSAAEQERYVHDALMQIAEYDANAVMNQSAYSALVNRKTVCAGYARAYQYLLQQLGIPCYYCTGYAGEDHAWNIVRLGSAYYNVDVTWDDTDTPTYDYFNKTDAEFGRTHVRTGLSVYLPACLGEGGSQTGSAVSGVGTGDAEDAGGDGQDGYEGLGDLIGENEVKPLEWISKVTGDALPEEEEEDQRARDLEAAGITEDELVETLEEYYADCLNQLKAAGAGNVQFTNVIPESLWNTVESAYSSGSYQKGYAEKLLEELKQDNIVIQLQAQRLGGGYYRVYHSAVIYSDPEEQEESSE